MGVSLSVIEIRFGRYPALCELKSSRPIDIEVGPFSEDSRIER